MRVTKRIREEYESLLHNSGEDKFYRHVFGTGILARRHFDRPENMMLDQSEAFFALFRNTGNNNYFIIGKILRRVAHRLYRDIRRSIPEYPADNRFIDSVK